VGGYAHPEALVETAWLAAHLADPAVRVIEVDEDAAAYREGHIPGAVAWHWSEDLHAKASRDYVGQEDLSRLLGQAGAGPGTAVVVYGANNNWFAAFAYWLLHYRGFDHVQLLNGGRQKWQAEGRPLVQAAPRSEPTGPRVPGPDRPGLRAWRDYVLAQVGHSVFVDVRSPEEYRGELLAPPHLPQEQAQVAGHIPGAINVPWARATNADGTFRAAEELRRTYQAEGIGPSSPVITYCRIGERSAHTWFVLHELLGYEDVRNYDGSWTEYGSLVGPPIEVGPGQAVSAPGPPGRPGALRQPRP
jgi:thiosulfate/3-mercaptopyruvate sulfurtransferase